VINKHSHKLCLPSYKDLLGKGCKLEQRVGETPLTVEEHLSIGGGQTSYGK